MFTRLPVLPLIDKVCCTENRHHFPKQPPEQRWWFFVRVQVCMKVMSEAHEITVFTLIKMCQISTSLLALFELALEAGFGGGFAKTGHAATTHHGTRVHATHA